MYIIKHQCYCPADGLWATLFLLRGSYNFIAIAHFVRGKRGPTVISLSSKLKFSLPLVSVLPPTDHTMAKRKVPWKWEGKRERGSLSLISCYCDLFCTMIHASACSGLRFSCLNFCSSWNSSNWDSWMFMRERTRLASLVGDSSCRCRQVLINNNSLWSAICGTS